MNITKDFLYPAPFYNFLSYISESDGFFDNLEIEILFKEKRILHKKFEDCIMKDAYFDYIVQKK